MSLGLDFYDGNTKFEKERNDKRMTSSLFYRKDEMKWCRFFENSPHQSCEILGTVTWPFI